MIFQMQGYPSNDKSTNRKLDENRSRERGLEAFYAIAGEVEMSSGLYRVYTKGEGYVVPIKKWEFLAAFVDKKDAVDWVHFQENSTDPEEDIQYKIMHNGSNV